MLNDIIKKTKEELNEATNIITDAGEAVTSSAASVVDGISSTVTSGRDAIKDISHKKIASVMDEFNEFLPVFEKAGYELLNYEIEISYSPKIIAHFMIKEYVSPEQQKEVLKEVRHKLMIKSVLETLIKTSYLHKHLEIGSLEFVGLEVHVGAVPTVRLLFGKPDSEKLPSHMPPPLPTR